MEEDTIDSVNSLKSIMEEEKDKKRLKVSRCPNIGCFVLNAAEQNILVWLLLLERGLAMEKTQVICP